jgi:hypothetical protein
MVLQEVLKVETAVPGICSPCRTASSSGSPDSDEGAAEVYFDLEKVVEAFCTSGIARAIVDMNRAADDFRKDGVIKTHTCYERCHQNPYLL